MFSGHIYKITNKITNMSYIGQTTTPLHIRFSNHCKAQSHCKYLSNAISAYGKENFTIEAILNVRSEDKIALKNILNKEEAKLIKELGTLVPNGYNLTTGGDSPSINKESLLERAKKHKKPIKCNETGQEWPSIRECADFFEVRSEFIHRVLRGVRDHFRGMSFSYINPERSKPRKIRQRKIRSLDSYNLSGFYEKINKQKIPIKCNETGQSWDSIREAAHYFGVTRETIDRVLEGKPSRFKKFTFSRI